MKITPPPFEVHFEEIDARRAQELLATNYAGNRNLSPSRVRHYTEEILRGDWLLTHQGIAICEDGNLIDGQHRLKSLVAADEVEPGITIPVMIASGVPMGAFTRLDNGGIRTAQSFMKGKYCSTRTALARTMLHIHENEGVVTLNTAVGRNFAPHRIVDFLAEQPKLAGYGMQYSEKASKAISSKMFQGTTAAGLMIGGYVAGFKDNAKWSAWWDDIALLVADGRGALPEKSAVRALSRTAPAGGNFTRHAYFKAIIAGTAFANDQPLSVIRVDNDRRIKVW